MYQWNIVNKLIKKEETKKSLEIIVNNSPIIYLMIINMFDPVLFESEVDLLIFTLVYSYYGIIYTWIMLTSNTLNKRNGDQPPSVHDLSRRLK